MPNPSSGCLVLLRVIAFVAPNITMPGIHNMNSTIMNGDRTVKERNLANISSLVDCIFICGHRDLHPDNSCFSGRCSTI